MIAHGEGAAIEWDALTALELYLSPIFPPLRISLPAWGSDPALWGGNDAVPCDNDWRQPTGVGRAVFVQCFAGVVEGCDRGAECRADAQQRLGPHRHLLPQSVGVAGVDPQLRGEGSERLQLIHDYFAGRMRIAWPPPGASTRWSREALVTERCVIVTGNGLSSQFALGPSA